MATDYLEEVILSTDYLEDVVVATDHWLLGWGSTSKDYLEELVLGTDYLEVVVLPTNYLEDVVLATVLYWPVAPCLCSNKSQGGQRPRPGGGLEPGEMLGWLLCPLSCPGHPVLSPCSSSPHLILSLFLVGSYWYQGEMYCSGTAGCYWYQGGSCVKHIKSHLYP